MGKLQIGIIGAGAMGSGIAQISATNGHSTIVYDTNDVALQKCQKSISNSLTKLVEKQKLSLIDCKLILNNLQFTSDLNNLSKTGLIIEAIVEKLELKKSLFQSLEKIVSNTCILVTNTSSLSITSIAAACELPERFIGIHFFNPAPLMPLVEIISGIKTQPTIVSTCKNIITSWNKTIVTAKDTPGFIVNRVARPFYSEALRILDEGLANIATIDWAMKEIGGFKMGPFELMDFIGHDVNYIVTETVWTQLYFDPRFKPSLTQKRLLEANCLGKKTGLGFYDYQIEAHNPTPIKDEKIGQQIVDRIVCLLIIEAIDTLQLNIATATDIDLAMIKGVNYPKGLLQWANEIGLKHIQTTINNLYKTYQEDRYRQPALLAKMVEQSIKFNLN